MLTVPACTGIGQARNPKSQALFAQAQASLPAGNSRTGAVSDPPPRPRGTALVV